MITAEKERGRAATTNPTTIILVALEAAPKAVTTCVKVRKVATKVEEKCNFRIGWVFQHEWASNASGDDALGHTHKNNGQKSVSDCSKL